MQTEVFLYGLPNPMHFALAGKVNETSLQSVAGSTMCSAPVDSITFHQALL